MFVCTGIPAVTREVQFLEICGNFGLGGVVYGSLDSPGRPLFHTLLKEAVFRIVRVTWA